jgi:ribosomal protein L37AE/L43A
MSKQPGRNPKRARRVFEARNGTGPWQCYSCAKEVVKIGRDSDDGNIHHLDEDVTNDTPGNLVIMHAVCHQHFHGPPTEDERRRISAKLKGRPSPTKGMKFSPEVNAKKSMPGELNPFYGRKHASDTLTVMRQPRRRRVCPDCGVEYALNWLTRHKQEGKCTGSPPHKPSPVAST